MKRAYFFSLITLAFCVMPTMASADSGIAKLQGGEQVIRLNETARFAITSSPTRSSEMHASCDLEAAGGASLIFDADHYVPLSDPAVGAAIALDGQSLRHFDLTGTIAANKGDAYVAFYFEAVPQAMCFPGMTCDGKAKSAGQVKVTCRDTTP